MSLAAIAAIRTARAIARPLPITWVSALGGWVGRSLLARGRRQRRAMANIAMAMPDLDESARSAITREMWESYGRTLAETLILDRIAQDPDRVEVANLEALDGDTSSGIVFVSLHFANWEVSTMPARGRISSVIGLYKPFRSEKLDAWVRKMRAPFYPDGMLPGDSTALLKCARVARRGGAVALLADHRDAAGIDVEFFGKPAPSTAFPAMLARRYGARIIAARVNRLEKGRFRVTLERVPVDRTDDMDADITGATEQVQAVFERWIRDEPGQWLWFYKRWRDNPAA